MPPPNATPKHPGHVASGRRGAEKRWGPAHDTRTVRLDSLPEAERRLIAALIRTAKKKAAPDVEPGTANGEEVLDDRVAAS